MSDRIVRDLRVQLTDAERLAKGHLLAQSAFDMNELVEAKTALTADYGKRIKKLKTLQGRLSYDYQSGTEERPVECEERARYQDLVMDIIRTDTGEVIETRPMTSQERQMKFSVVPLRPAQRKREDDDQEPDPTTQH